MLSIRQTRWNQGLIWQQFNCSMLPGCRRCNAPGRSMCLPPPYKRIADCGLRIADFQSSILNLQSSISKPSIVNCQSSIERLTRVLSALAQIAFIGTLVFSNVSPAAEADVIAFFFDAEAHPVDTDGDG